jgi:hypothetical protein
MLRAQPVGKILPMLGFRDHAMISNSFNLLFSWIIFYFSFERFYFSLDEPRIWKFLSYISNNFNSNG